MEIRPEYLYYIRQRKKISGGYVHFPDNGKGNLQLYRDKKNVNVDQNHWAFTSVLNNDGSSTGFYLMNCPVEAAYNVDGGEKRPYVEAGWHNDPNNPNQHWQLVNTGMGPELFPFYCIVNRGNDSQAFDANINDPEIYEKNLNTSNVYQHWSFLPHYRLDIKLTGFDYNEKHNPDIPANNIDKVVQSWTITNPTSSTMIKTFREEITDSSSSTITLKETVSVGTEASVTVSGGMDVGFEASTTIKFHFNYDSEHLESNTVTNSRSYTDELVVSVPPYSAVEIVVMESDFNASVDVSLTGTITGNVFKLVSSGSVISETVKDKEWLEYLIATENKLHPKQSMVLFSDGQVKIDAIIAGTGRRFQLKATEPVALPSV